jgi:hypothetical protein
MSGSALRSLTVAAKGKGAVNLARRVATIGSHYGLGPRRMDRRLASILEIVERHGCRATLPITAAAVQRNPRVVARYAERGIEFAMHGLRHVDHRALGAVEQIEQFGIARRIFDASGIRVVGFRAPYLRCNDATLHALRENGFQYDSTQAIDWPVAPGIVTDGYRRALTFYDARPALEHASLPWMEDGIVRIPCSIPDDEAAVDRLRLSSPRSIAELWLDVFRATHARGELFTLAVHPERIERCGPAIAAVLEEARTAVPEVWIARLDEIARWWRRRAETEVAVRPGEDGWLRVDIRGPEGMVVFGHGVEIPGAQVIGDGAVRVDRPRFDVRTGVRPLIALHPTSPDRLQVFLREQGFLVEVADSPTGYTRFLHRERFTAQDELPLLQELQAGQTPLLQLGRWPGGLRSALSVTGDVDALTIWDYASRFVGR